MFRAACILGVAGIARNVLLMGGGAYHASKKKKGRTGGGAEGRDTAVLASG